MRADRFVRLSVMSGLALILLLFVWLALLPTGPAQSLGSKTPFRVRATTAAVSAPTMPITDTRWLDLIRLARSTPPGNRVEDTPQGASAALPTLHLHLTDNLIAGRVPLASPVLISVTRAGSLLISTGVIPFPDDNGYLYIASVSYWYLSGGGGGGGWYGFQPGDVVQVAQAGASISMTVPLLTGLVDTQFDRVYGMAPINQAVTTYLYPFVTPDVFYTRTVATDVAGQYQAIYSPTLDVRPRDSGYVAYAETPDRVAYVRVAAPFLRVQTYGSEITGVAEPQSILTITAIQPGGTPHGQLYADSGYDGSFSTYDYGYGYASLALQPGDHVIVSSTHQAFSMTVMAVTAHADLAHQQVWGDTTEQQAVQIYRFDGPITGDSFIFQPENAVEQTTVTATLSGQYTASLALQRPNYGAALVTSPEGHQTYALFAVPYLSARMGRVYSAGYYLDGQVDAQLVPLTITIQGPSGYAKDVRTVKASHNGYFSDWTSEWLTLNSGDVISVTTAQQVQMAVQLPSLTGQIDVVSDTVSGFAPPGTRLTVNLYSGVMAVALGGGGPPPYNYTTIVTATAQGDYFLDLHGIFDLGNFASGTVFMRTPDGHQVSRYLEVVRQEGCDAQLRAVSVGGNHLQFQLPTHYCYTGPRYGTLRVYDPGHHLKGKMPLSNIGWWDYTIYLYTGTQPVLLLPNDTIEIMWSSTPPNGLTPVSASSSVERFLIRTARTATPAPWATPIPIPTPPPPADQFITITVPTLTIQLDRVANIIHGQAPASATVTLNGYLQYSPPQVFTATVDAQGYYTSALPGKQQLLPGDSVTVTYAPPESPSFWATAVLPTVRARLYRSSVWGWLAPFTPYTVTLETTRPVSATYKGTTYSDAAFSAYLVPLEPDDTVAVTTPQQTLRLTLPYLTAHVNQATATIFGQAPPNARLGVELYGYGPAQSFTATTGGIFSITLPVSTPLHTNYGTLTYFDPNDHQVLLDFATVHWEVALGYPCFNGIVDMAQVPVTLTLRTETGTLKSAVVLTPTYPQYQGCFTASIESNDRIELDTIIASEVFTVPVLTARHNYARQAVEGQTAPNQEVHVWLLTDRRTWPDADGNYGIDTSDLPLSLGMRGSAQLADAVGNTTTRYFTITGYQVYLPVIRRNP